MNKFKDYQIGDKVRFGAYGYNDETDKVYTIVGKDTKLSHMFGIEYELKSETGNTFHAYEDEIFPIK